MSKDPFEDAGGTVVPDAEHEASGFFWQPAAPCYVIGTMDRIETGKKFGDYARLTGVVQFRAADHKPEAMRSELGIGLSSPAMEGKLSPADAGTLVRIDFIEWRVLPSQRKMRVFMVRKGLDAAKVLPVLKKAADRLAQDAAVVPDDDDLPF